MLLPCTGKGSVGQRKKIEAKKEKNTVETNYSFMKNCLFILFF